MATAFKSYVREMLEADEARKRIVREKRHSEVITSGQEPRQVKPLTDQIAELMRSLPSQVLNRPWSMGELVGRLQGKYRDSPHPQEVGEALRRLNWTRQRYWGKGYDGVRLWIPPPGC